MSGSPSSPTLGEAGFITGGGQVGALMRSMDWSASPIGSPDSWPQSLRSAVSIMLPSHAQIALFWGPEFVALYNDAYAPAIGNRHPGALGRPAHENWSELWDMLRPLFQGVLDTGESFWAKDYAFRVERHGYPEEVFFDIAYDPIRDESGEVGGIFCVVSETTSRVHGERRLRCLTEIGNALQGKETVAGVSEAALEAMQRSDRSDLRYALVYLLDAPDRARFAGSYGATPSQGPQDVFLDDRRSPWGRLFTEAQRSRHLVEGDAHALLTLEDDAKVLDRLFVLPMVCPGEPVGFIVVGPSELVPKSPDYLAFLRLVSAQVCSALTTVLSLQEIRQRSELLERMVGEAVAEREASAEQLRQAYKMDAIGKLTGGIAHDFNNLLQVIGGNLQLLLKELKGQASAERRLGNALTAVERGAKLASQLLAFGRRQPLEPRTIHLGRLVRDLDEMLRRALGEAIEIETIVAGGLWKTLVDPSQVENALLNLAINARDAMAGAGKLTIELGNAYLDHDYARRHSEVEPGQYVMLAVTDTGCGMAPELIERVFEPFFTTKPEGQGTGLGLSMVYGFTKQSGGHIKVYSEVGQGTTIRLYLPRSRSEDEIVTQHDHEPILGGTETILVVEDDEGVRQTVVEMLTDLGYRVLQAKDAQAALSVVESGLAIDLLFTDVVMPGPVRSVELARRAKETFENIGILFTSGYTENAIVHGGRLDEGTNLLSKPYTREALARRVRQVLQAKGRETEPAQITMIRGSRDGGQGGSRRVLLLEADPAARRAIDEMLLTLGHTVVAVGDLAEASLVLGTRPIDLVVIDGDRPGKAAAESVERIAALHLGVPIVVAGIDAAVAARLGVVALGKPFDAMALGQAIERTGQLAKHGRHTRG